MFKYSLPMSNIIITDVDSAKKSIEAYTEAINPDSDKFKSFPLILNQPQAYNTSRYTPYIGINPYNSNVVSSGFYYDLNKDKSVQKNLTKYYFYKILDKWIYKELMPLLAFVDISSEKPRLINSLSQYDVKKLLTNSEEQIEKKINYLERFIITKDMVRHVLKKICSENGINWYHLDKNEKKIKTVFYNYLLSKLKESIKKYGYKDKNLIENKNEEKYKLEEKDEDEDEDEDDDDDENEDIDE